jgi:hypothetical protein
MKTQTAVRGPLGEDFWRYQEGLVQPVGICVLSMKSNVVRADTQDCEFTATEATVESENLSEVARGSFFVVGGSPEKTDHQRYLPARQR